MSVAGALLLVMAIAWSYVVNYQPLARGGITGVGPACFDELGSVDLPSGGDITLLALSCDEEGDRARWSVTLENHGPLAVTIFRLGLDDGATIFPFASLTTRSYDESRHEVSGGVEPDLPDLDDPDSLDGFPVVMEPGAVRIFVFYGVMQRCRPRHRGGGATIVSLPLAYEVLGFSRQESLFLPVQAQLHCPSA